jgi:hypothetical protein
VRRAAAVAGVVLGAHAAWIGAYLAGGHGFADFVKTGAAYAQHGRHHTAIRFEPGWDEPADSTRNLVGYDGQFSYYMAVDFVHAREHMDIAGYRYSRVLYPLTARVLALGSESAVPFMLVLVNWLAIGAGTLALAVWLPRRGRSPWFALIYGLFPGLLLALALDLTEPLGYALAAAGITILDGRSRRRLMWAGLAFGLAGLARQTTLVFPLGCAIAMGLGWGDRDGEARTEAARSRWRRAGGLAALAVAPYLLWELVLRLWLEPAGSTPFLQPIPLAGFVAPGSWRWSAELPQLGAVAAPTLACVAIAVLLLWRGERRAAPLLLLVNALLIVFGPTYGNYLSAGRNATGVVLAAVLCLPLLHAGSRRLRAVAWATAAAAFAALPLALAYVLLDLHG